MAQFKKRCAAVGAKLNEEDNSPRERYEFLGEAYDHKAKTRALTTKHQTKIEQLYGWLMTRGSKKPTARQVFSMVGLLWYAAEILDLEFTQYTPLLKEHTDIARQSQRAGTWNQKVCLSAAAWEAARKWTLSCRANIPVHVTNGRHPAVRCERRIEIWVDASAWGFGAVVKMSTGVRHITQQWTVADHEEARRQGGNLFSSVTAEPMALRRVLCMLRLQPNTEVTVWTDHSSLTSAVARRWSGVESYEAVRQLIADLMRVSIVVTLRFVPGVANPADALSRGEPPLLAVTAIGGAQLGDTKARQTEKGV